ncbi:ATP cone domain-containing protein [Flagellimonas halotolerans]|uniref:ATP cone domain-containing protein n=1 Tax=Flagellimonas halotolerans TaxID=3112164 RepID=A0ABU6IT34_9FLAO|nr:MULTISPECIES: ATP cone domain-containing protein [unclassified Allomuricauda]MEC3966425.1 ATP cone domain-containing protein [Muricauda sp. SYSU M86414]MEC4266290.1 ATP cone domain-containing protein [Muricauda sp. SYSU M84420]
MATKQFHITKSTGEKVDFSMEKLKNSLQFSGASEALVEDIVQRVQDELYQGISTREIYNRAFALLKKKESVYASKYKLKKAIYELGPTGFPFEKFISGILHYSGYQTKVGEVLQGSCVSHEIDVLALKNETLNIIECKFHSEDGLKCNVKIPLYIHSRYQDVKLPLESQNNKDFKETKGWLATNTRFTQDALEYGKCVGLYLLSWDYPHGNGLKERIDRLRLYPITVSTLLSNREKQFLLQRDMVLCRQLIKNSFLLDHLGVSNGRKQRILKEMKSLCNS